MLIFRDFFTNGMDCLLVFCLSPGPWVSLAAPPRCLLSSVPITLSPHRVPVILPTLWRVFLHPRPSFLTLFPRWCSDPHVLNSYGSVQVPHVVPALLTLWPSAGVGQGTPRCCSGPASSLQCLLLQPGCLDGSGL